jgi:TolB-like protein
MQKNIVVFIFLCLSLASATDMIAVNNLKTTSVPESEASLLTDALRSELGKSGKYQVLERSQMEEILKEQGIQQSGACDEASCAIEMGKLLAVNYIILGNVGKIGKTYTVSVRLVDVGTGIILQDVIESQKCMPDELLTTIVPMLAKKLAGTYKPNRHFAWWTVGGIVGAAAIVVPILILSRKDNGPGNSDITIHW